MIILWIRKNKKDNQKNSSIDEKESFQAHDEVMKSFRLAHQELDVISDKDILTGNGNMLAPVRGVKLNEHVQN
jgi:Rps23 Pro-64 3,4-dihydroxylase Tpa1-like proline 4-hydroxylase